MNVEEDEIDLNFTQEIVEYTRDGSVLVQQGGCTITFEEPISHPGDQEIVIEESGRRMELRDLVRAEHCDENQLFACSVTVN